MQLSLILVAASALAASAVTVVPISREPFAGSHIERHQYHRDGGIARAQRMMLPNNSRRRRAPSSTSLVNVRDSLFYANVQVGSNTFQIDLDTGSADTWVRGASCTSNDGSCDGAKLDTSAPGVTALNIAYEVKYGSGQVKGAIYKAPVSIGDATVASMPVGVASQEEGFSGEGSDGLMGLAFNTISDIADKTKINANFVDNLKLQGADDRFAFYFSNYADAKDSGEVTFGGVDTTRFTGEPVYLPLSSQTYWQFSLSGAKFSVGATSGALSTNQITDAIADTGTTLIILPAKIAQTINAALGSSGKANGADVWILDCGLRTSGPDIVFTMGGHDFAIPASVYVMPNGKLCTSGFTDGAEDSSVVIFGDVFLRQYYSIYDKTQKAVGFALANHQHGDAPPPETTVVPPASTTTADVPATSTTTVDTPAHTTTTDAPVQTTTAGPTYTQTTTADAPESTQTSAVAPTSTQTTAVAPSYTQTSVVAPASTQTTADAPSYTQTSAVAPASTQTTAGAPAYTQTSAVAPASTQTTAGAPAYTQTSAAAPASTQAGSPTYVASSASAAVTAPAYTQTSAAAAVVTATPAYGAPTSGAAPVVTYGQASAAAPAVTTTPVVYGAASTAAPVATVVKKPKCHKRR
ncbi:Vacuolar protease A [Irineochytrium annulatum]|nr:Vacuolar protease A [Irineochytrium annulatum]